VNSRNYPTNKQSLFVLGMADTSITDSNDLHHKLHCENIASFENVFVIEKNEINLKQGTGEIKNNFILRMA
jgi:hypothetical protein